MVYNDIIGIWDFHSKDNRLGSLFIFIQELELYSPSQGIIGVVNYKPENQPFVDLMTRFSSHKIFILTSQEISHCAPLIHELEPRETTSRCGSLIWITHLYKATGQRAKLPHNKRVIFDTSTVEKTVTVHLKNNVNDRQSNASQTEWYNALGRLNERFPQVRFVLIGDDAMDKPFHALANVDCLKGSVADYFSAVVESDGFAGMSSAFCGAAILGRKPYRIWKHVGHHSDEMVRELDDNGQFPINTVNQTFLTAYDNEESIINELVAMLNQLISTAHV